MTQSKQSKRLSLVEYAATHKRRNGSKAWMDGVPERDECVKAYQDGVSIATIRDWLADECGYGELASRNRVAGWLQVHGKKAPS